MGILPLPASHHRRPHAPPAIFSRSSGCRRPACAGRRLRPGRHHHAPRDAHPEDPVQDHLGLDRRAPSPASSWAGSWGRSTATITDDRRHGSLHPDLLPDHHALHRVPRRDAEVRVARPGLPLPLLQGEERRPELQDPGHERHHRRPDHRPLRHGLHRGHAGHPPVRPQGAPARRRFRRRAEAAAGPARPRHPQPSPEILPDLGHDHRDGLPRHPGRRLQAHRAGQAARRARSSPTTSTSTRSPACTASPS